MAPRPPPRKQISAIRFSDVPVPVSSSTPLDSSGLVAQVADTPVLARVVDMLRRIEKLVEQVMWNKEQCLQLKEKSLVLLLVICDHWYGRRSEKPKLEDAIERTAAAFSHILNDLPNWTRTSLSETKRNQILAAISHHDRCLRRCMDYLSLAALLQIHDSSTETLEPLTASSQDQSAQHSIAPLKTKAPTQIDGSNPRPLPRKQTTAVQLFDIPVVVSAETVLDVARLAACCAPVPGLSPIVETLRTIYASVDRVSRNESRCRKLSTLAMALVYIICDHYDNERADTPKLQTAIERTVQAMCDIDVDLRAWAALPILRSWYLRNEVDLKITEHEDNLKSLAEYLSLSATLQIHEKVAALQESLKNNPSGSANRKRAEEQLYRLRNAPPGELADLTPPELTCECVRLGSQPEHSGIENDIWKGRWLDKQDVALIVWKSYFERAKDENALRTFERRIKVRRWLDNPYVLRLYGWCRFEGETYLVTPWLRSRDVVKYLDRDRNRHRKCLSLITEIALGLSYLHNHDIIHGSLKPSNILVQDDGRAVLSDFSLTKFATLASKNLSVQASAFRYWAPEVILEEPISKASDVYSWAMTALEIITGDPPFRNLKSSGALIARVIMESQIPNRSDYKSPVLDKHPEIWSLFVQSWNRQAGERPTAKEIVEVLESIRAGAEY